MYNVCVKDLDEQMKKIVVKNKKKQKLYKWEQKTSFPKTQTSCHSVPCQS